MIIESYKYEHTAEHAGAGGTSPTELNAISTIEGKEATIPRRMERVAPGAETMGHIYNTDVDPLALPLSYYLAPEGFTVSLGRCSSGFASTRVLSPRL